jgi:molybdopterin converting factor small subunit
MKITIDYIAQAKTAAGTSSEIYTVADHCPLRDVLAHASKQQGAALTTLVFDPNGKIRPSILIAVNHEQVFTERAPVLKNGDVIALMSPMSGG